MRNYEVDVLHLIYLFFNVYESEFSSYSNSISLSFVSYYKSFILNKHITINGIIHTMLVINIIKEPFYHCFIETMITIKNTSLHTSIIIINILLIIYWILLLISLSLIFCINFINLISKLTISNSTKLEAKDICSGIEIYSNSRLYTCVSYKPSIKAPWLNFLTNI